MKKNIICLILIIINFLFLVGNQLFIKYSLDEYKLQESITLVIESEMDKLSILAIVNLLSFVILLYLRKNK